MMKKNFNSLIVVFSLVVFSTCASAPKVADEKFVGTWANEWFELTIRPDNSGVLFFFDEDGNIANQGPIQLLSGGTKIRFPNGEILEIELRDNQIVLQDDELGEMALTKKTQ
jgi:hypothetical protein